MSFLDSLLGSMAAPPVMSDKEKNKRKQERELAQKMEARHKDQIRQFRLKMEAKLKGFVQSDDSHKMVFDPMDIVQRQLIHDVAEVAGVVAHSFGEEGVDRHVVVWKKDWAPGDEELQALRQGRTYDPEQTAKEKAQRQKEEQEEDERRRKGSAEFVPRSNYKQKYEHLIGSEAALEAAKKTELNKTYGMVSSESKKDRRSVEDIQADIRAKKKQKLNQAH